MENILAVDPSLTGTGLCVLNIYESFVVLDKIKFEKDEQIKEKDFKHIYERVKEIEDNYLYFLDLYKPDIVVMESPLPLGQMSSALSILATSLVGVTLSKFEFVYLLHPAFLQFVIKKRYSKEELVLLAKDIMEKEEFIPSVKRFSVDEAVAFLMAYRMGIKLGRKNRSGNERFNVEREKVLQRRDKEWQKVRLQRIEAGS